MIFSAILLGFDVEILQKLHICYGLRAWTKSRKILGAVTIACS